MCITVLYSVLCADHFKKNFFSSYLNSNSEVPFDFQYASFNKFYLYMSAILSDSILNDHTCTLNLFLNTMYYGDCNP